MTVENEIRTSKYVTVECFRANAGKFGPVFIQFKNHKVPLADGSKRKKTMKEIELFKITLTSLIFITFKL